MRRHRRAAMGGLGVVMFLAGSLNAQEQGLSKDLKIRTGYGLSTQDHLRAASIGFGFCVNYGFSAGTINLEAGYYYKTGDQYIEPTQGEAPSNLFAVNPGKSGDSRRNQVDGFSVRVGFQRPIVEDWSWQAGLMLGGTRFRHEYVGDMQGQDWTWKTDGSQAENDAHNAKTWRDTYSGVLVEGGLKVSPYAGVSFKVTPYSSVELNLVGLNYTAVNYMHHPGSGIYNRAPEPADQSIGRIADHNAFPGDGMEKKNRLSPQLEFAYVFHF